MAEERKDKEKAINILEERIKQKRRVIEFWENDADIAICIYLKELKEEVKAYEMAIEALKNQESEKERIIKELENEVKYWKDRHFDQKVSDEKARSYQHAIEIVKRGGRK